MACVIRQLTAKDAHKVMLDSGVRFNDLGTFQRANSYPAVKPPLPITTNKAA